LFTFFKEDNLLNQKESVHFRILKNISILGKLFHKINPGHLSAEKVASYIQKQHLYYLDAIKILIITDQEIFRLLKILATVSLACRYSPL
jgi:hypothetical protein